MTNLLFCSISSPQLPQIQGVGIELRLDLFPKIDLAWIEKVCKTAAPIMLTLRRTGQREETEREALIEKLLSFAPKFFDLEYDMRPEFLSHVLAGYPKTQFVLSYHNFEEVPSDLEAIYRQMSRFPAFTYKLACIVRSTNEAIKLLLFAKNHPKTSGICMGEKGAFARVLGPVVGNLIGFASLSPEEATAPGQLSVSELFETYRYPLLNRQTAIYGLIGDPVHKSPGHLHHNGVFRKCCYNAVYVKMVVKPEELAEFIQLARELPIRGLSVTIPLKEAILPFVDSFEPAAIGAVNTLIFKEGKIFGTNTDGVGALDAIEKKGLVRGKKVVLLGAGGAARGIAFEAKARSADVLILNRTVQRARDLAEEFGCEAGGLDEVPSDYDVLINCSPDPMPIDPAHILPNTIAMDVVYSPRDTPFLQAASAKHCQLVYGEEMFLNQAAGQTRFWLPQYK